VNASLTRWCVVGFAGWLVLAAPVSVGAFQTVRGTSTPDYQGTGVIIGIHPPPSALHPTRPVIVLRHDPIVGLMDESMTMPFIAASTDLFQGVKAGDRVTFGLKSTEDALLVISVQRVTSVRRR
jgi:Cu/Ag efflux protein CusF